MDLFCYVERVWQAVVRWTQFAQLGSDLWCIAYRGHVAIAKDTPTDDERLSRCYAGSLLHALQL